MVPAIAILITRRLEQKAPKPPLGIKISLMAVAALSLWVAKADFQLADTARNSAQQAGAKYGGAGRNIWFEGHWGFQYYMQSAGARPLDMQTMQFATGDLLIIPEDNANVHDLDPKIAVLQEDIYVPSFPWLATLNIGAGAGFYSQRVGPLPFAFGHIWPEDVAIYRLQKPAAPAH